MKSLSLGFHKLRTLDVAVLSLLLALGLIVDRFTVGTKSIQIGFGFIIIAAASYLYGPLWSSVIAALSDIIGTLTSGGVYNPGFTISAILGATIYGLFFYRQEFTLTKVIFSQLIIAIFVNTILNTLWLSMMWHTPFMGYLPIRLLKEIVITPIQIAIIYLAFISPQFERIKDKLLG
ncbi:folate family ECF transporter S component [Lentilactobacillus raoultii]|uniref:Folate family ECF transporter S component n=1 Tax=Lentilactobacillus raoultii TaxID=1987503 RepID=A0ABW3PEG4_9LACO|nr:folate family ECF transporter S component [Lentilactobacillus raoultii]